MNSKTTYSEQELVALLQQRNEKAFGYLYDNYSGALYGIVNSIVTDKEIANDVLQNVFVNIWRKIESYDTNKGASSGAPFIFLYCPGKSYLILRKEFSLKKINPSFVPPLCWLIISTFLLTIPGNAFPKENWLDKIWLDKWVHIGLFAIMVTLWCWAMLKIYSVGTRLRTIFIWIGLASLIYGIGMEFVQKYFITNRSFDVGDIVADAVGCVLGGFFSRKRFIKK